MRCEKCAGRKKEKRNRYDFLIFASLCIVPALIAGLPMLTFENELLVVTGIIQYFAVAFICMFGYMYYAKQEKRVIR